MKPYDVTALRDRLLGRLSALGAVGVLTAEEVERMTVAVLVERVAVLERMMPDV